MPHYSRGFRDFQEHLGGVLCVTFPDGLGAGREESQRRSGACRGSLGAPAKMARLK